MLLCYAALMADPVDPIALARALINCPSVTPARGEVFDVLDEALTGLGFTVHRWVMGEAPDGPTENMVAIRGSGSPHFGFAGHLDVVPPGEGWTGDPFMARIENGVLIGRGANDMKSAIAAFVAAVSTIDQTEGTISLLITGDEEGYATYGTPRIIDWLNERGVRPDMILIGEPTSVGRLGDTVKIGRRGSVNMWIEIPGVQGHVAYPHLADNPIKGLVQALARIYDTPLDYGSAHFAPSNFEVTNIDVGNKATNVIPAGAVAHFNIRYNDKHSPETLKAHLREQVQLALKPTGLSFTLDFEPPSHQFLTQLGPLDALLSQAVNEVTGLIPTLSTEGGTSDARFIKDYCPVVEFGLLAETIHKVDEHIAVADLHQLTAVYRRFIELYFETFGAANEK